MGLPTKLIDRSPRQRGRPWARRRARQLRLQPLCVTCAERGRTVAAEEVDHRVALVNGGPDSDDNLQSLCRDCHVEKTGVDLGWSPKGCDAAGAPTDPRHHWNSPVRPERGADAPSSTRIEPPGP